MVNKGHRGIYITPDRIPNNVRYTFYPYLYRCKCDKSEIMAVIMAVSCESACCKAVELRCKGCTEVVESSIRLLNSENRHNCVPTILAEYGK